MFILILNKSIFKAYDIRGIYPEELDENTARIITRALIHNIKPKTMLISKDTRSSGPSLLKGVISAIPDNIKVYYIELSTTPMLYFFAGKLGVDLSIMITASHNPPHFNGFKISGKNVYPVSGEEILKMIEKEKLSEHYQPISASVSLEEIKGAVMEYRKFLLSHIDIKNFRRPLNIVCDCANGTAGIVLAQLFRDLPVNLVFLCMMPDGTFPNHDPNPLILKNIQHLSDFMKKGEFDIGVAFDGDADRVIFLDEKGNPVSSDLMIIYLARILKNKQGIKKVFIDTRSSQIVVEELKRANIEVQRIKAGHLYMRRKLAENSDCFAGELSGHFYYKNNYNADSAILTMLYVLEQLASSNMKISEVVKDFKKYVSSGELSYETPDKELVLQKIDKYFTGCKKEYIDGISIYEEDCYINVRKSNTENLVRVVIEATTIEHLEKIKEKIEKIILHEG